MTLKATNESIRVTTSTGADVDFFVHYADIDTGAYDSTNYGKITTATTTEVLPAGGADVTRMVLMMSLVNIEAAADNTVVVNLYDGTNNYRMYSGALLRDEKLMYVKGEGWKRYDANGKMVFVGDPGTPGADGAAGGTVTWVTIADTDFAIEAGKGYNCQIGDLTGGHSVDVSTLAEGEGCEFMIGQTDYTLTIVGDTVYVGGGEMALDSIPNGGHTVLKKIDGKLILY